MRGLHKHFIFALAVIAAWSVMTVTAQQPAGPFTAAQATAGQTVYQTSCAGCHGADLAGLNDAA